MCMSVCLFVCFVCVYVCVGTIAISGAIELAFMFRFAQRARTFGSADICVLLNAFQWS